MDGSVAFYRRDSIVKALRTDLQPEWRDSEMARWKFFGGRLQQIARSDCAVS